MSHDVPAERREGWVCRGVAGYNVHNVVNYNVMNVADRNKLYLKGILDAEGLFPRLEVSPKSGFALGVVKLPPAAGASRDFELFDRFTTYSEAPPVKC
jgi:hypothetical protein